MTESDPQIEHYTGTLISDLQTLVNNVVLHRRPTPAQWQAAKQRPTQFGDSKNTPQIKARVYESEAESDMERERR